MEADRQEKRRDASERQRRDILRGASNYVKWDLSNRDAFDAFKLLTIRPIVNEPYFKDLFTGAPTAGHGEDPTTFAARAATWRSLNSFLFDVLLKTLDIAKSSPSIAEISTRFVDSNDRGDGLGLLQHVKERAERTSDARQRTLLVEWRRLHESQIPANISADDLESEMIMFFDAYCKLDVHRTHGPDASMTYLANCITAFDRRVCISHPLHGTIRAIKLQCGLSKVPYFADFHTYRSLLVSTLRDNEASVDTNTYLSALSGGGVGCDEQLIAAFTSRGRANADARQSQSRTSSSRRGADAGARPNPSQCPHCRFYRCTAARNDPKSRCCLYNSTINPEGGSNFYLSFLEWGRSKVIRDPAISKDALTPAACRAEMSATLNALIDDQEGILQEDAPVADAPSGDDDAFARTSPQPLPPMHGETLAALHAALPPHVSIHGSLLDPAAGANTLAVLHHMPTLALASDAPPAVAKRLPLLAAASPSGFVASPCAAPPAPHGNALFDTGASLAATNSMAGLVGELSACHMPIQTAASPTNAHQIGTFRRTYLCHATGTPLTLEFQWYYMASVPFDIIPKCALNKLGFRYVDSSPRSYIVSKSGARFYLSTSANLLEWFKAAPARVEPTPPCSQLAPFSRRALLKGHVGVSEPPKLSDYQKLCLAHCRLGHPSLDVLLRTMNTTLLTKLGRVKISTAAIEHFKLIGCDVCNAMKLRRSAVRANPTVPIPQGENPVRKVYCDAFGKFRTPSAQFGFQYILLFVCSLPGLNWACGSKSLDAAAYVYCLNKFRAATRHLGEIEVLRVDQFSTSKSVALLEYFSEALISRQGSPAYQHAYLGVVERCWYPMAANAATMLRHGRAPETQWFNACIHALFIDNIKASRRASEGPVSSAYLRAHAAPFDDSQLLPFYCPLRYAIGEPLRNGKLGEKAAVGRYVGIAPDNPAAIHVWDGRAHHTVIGDWVAYEAEFCNLHSLPDGMPAERPCPPPPVPSPPATRPPPDQPLSVVARRDGNALGSKELGDNVGVGALADDACVDESARGGERTASPAVLSKPPPLSLARDRRLNIRRPDALGGGTHPHAGAHHTIAVVSAHDQRETEDLTFTGFLAATLATPLGPPSEFLDPLHYSLVHLAGDAPFSVIQSPPQRCVFVEGNVVALSAGETRDWLVPKNQREFNASPQRMHWQAARDRAIDDWRTLGVFVETLSLPPGTKPIRTLWVDKLKHNADGTYACKSRPCIVDKRPTEDVFSPTPQLISVLSIIAMGTAASATQEVIDFQFDAHCAFQQTKVSETDESRFTYIQPLPGYGSPGAHWKLLVHAQGTRPAAKEFRLDFTRRVASIGFHPTFTDQCVYVHTSRSGVFSLHVDDGLGWTTDPAIAAELRAFLDREYPGSKFAGWNDYIGYEVRRNLGAKTTKVTAARLIHKLCDELLDGTYTHAPSSPSAPSIMKLTGEPAPEPSDPSHADYDLRRSKVRSALGSLIFITAIRVDARHATTRCCRHMATPSADVLAAVQHIMLYLRGSVDDGLTYHANAPLEQFAPDVGTFNLHVCRPHYHVITDANLETDRSVCGVIHMLGGAAISAMSFRQHSIAPDASVAEIFAASTATTQAIHTRELLHELGLQQLHPTPIFTDNSAINPLAQEGATPQRNPFVVRRTRYMQEQKTAARVAYHHIDGTINPADGFTKYIPRKQWAAQREYYTGMR